jgi:hypothetical protein
VEERVIEGTKRSRRVKTKRENTQILENIEHGIENRCVLKVLAKFK